MHSMFQSYKERVQSGKNNESLQILDVYAIKKSFELYKMRI